jgi:hypothetical protein
MLCTIINSNKTLLEEMAHVNIVMNYLFQRLYVWQGATQLYLYKEISPLGGRGCCQKYWVNVQIFAHECENSRSERVEHVTKCAKVQIVAHD